MRRFQTRILWILKRKTKEKTLIAIGIATLLGTGAVMGLREAHIKKAQQTFKEVFMRDAITRKETIDILKRYKEIEKIKDNNEYVKAMFDEAKKNYGLSNIGKLKLRYDKTFDEFIEGLGNESSTATVSIKTTAKRKDLGNIIHHELRHIKQDYYAINYDAERFINPINAKKTGVLAKYKSTPKDFEEMWGIKFDKNNVPEKYQEFAKKVLDNLEHYIEPTIDCNGYRHQFIEEDAYNCGNKIEVIIKSLRNILI